MMDLFGKKKEAARRSQEETAMCECGNRCRASDIKAKKAGCCGADFSEETMTKAADAKVQGSGIKVLGSGCAKCRALEAAAHEALVQLGMDAAVDHVTDFAQIAAYGVMTTPALVVDGKVVSYGKVLKKDEIVALLRKSRA